MVKDKSIKGAEMTSNVACDICATSKQVRKSFKTIKEEAEIRESSRSDAVVCSDVLGPITPVPKSGYSYIVTFIMMKSRYVAVYPFRKKKATLRVRSSGSTKRSRPRLEQRLRCCKATTAASTGARR